MKRTVTLSLILALLTSSLALAQSGGMKDMGKNDMDMQKCMDMKDMNGSDMKGMDMKDMDAQTCKDMMNGKGSKHQAKDVKTMKHKAVAVVNEVDAANGKVTLAHEAVKSLNWPPMTMGFTVRNKKLFDKLTVGKRVNVEFKQQGSDYVVTAVK